jgi:hypothetical protein
MPRPPTHPLSPLLPLLCSELMAGSNIPSKSELIEYTQQHPVWASASERLQVRGVYTTPWVGRYWL